MADKNRPASASTREGHYLLVNRPHPPAPSPLTGKGRATTHDGCGGAAGRRLRPSLSQEDGLTQDQNHPRAEVATRAGNGEHRWQSLFEGAPIPIWEEDFSAVSQRFGELRAAGVGDLEDHLARRPQEVVRLARLVRIAEASHSTVGFFGLRSKNELPGALSALFGESSYPVFARELCALWRGESAFECEIELRAPGSGRRILAVRRHCVAPGFEGTLSRVVVSFLDLTELAAQREAAREKAEQRDRFFDLALDMLCITDAQGHFLFLNRAWERTLGYRLEELLGKSFMDFVHPEDAETTRRSFAEVRTGKSVLNFVNRYRCKDGSSRWLEWHSSPSFGPFVYAAARDITRRRRAEEVRMAHLRFLKDLGRFDQAIRQTDDLEKMMESGLNATRSIFESDRTWLLYPCDPNAPSWTVPMERTRPEYPGAFSAGIVVPMNQEAREIFKAALASPDPVPCDPRTGGPLPRELVEAFTVRSQIFLAVHPKLGAPWLLGMHQCSHPRIWADEEILLFGEIGRRLADGLSSMLLLKDLRESEEKHKLLIETTNTGYVILDAQGRVTDANREYLRLAGRRELKEILGKDVSEWTAAHERERLAAAKARCLEQGSIRNLELDYVGADGRTTPVEMNASLLCTAKATSIMAVCRDITDRRRADDDLREAARRKDEFLAMLGHELRNPMAPIRNATCLLRRLDSGDPRGRRAREIIERQTAHLTRIVDDLLDVSRIARGKISLRREQLDWAAIVRDAAEDHRGSLEARGVALRVEIPVAPLWVEGDATRLAQVLSNLLHNSEKFTQAGGTVALELRPSPEGKAAVLTVEDTGMGMSKETLGRLFAPFVQAGTDLARSRGGLGLGLALVKGLLDLHGGSIEAASEGQGRGSRFTVELPLLETPAQRPAPRPSGVSPGSVRVLIIEDNSDAAESLQSLLELRGHTVRTAGDGLEGLRAARAFRPDVILCDIGLPGELDGYGVAEAIRADPALRSVLAVAVSGYGQLEDKRRAAQASFNLHLTKPVEPDELERVLTEWSSRRGSSPEPRAT